MTGAVTAPAEALELLSTGRVEVLGLMPHASNHTFLAEVATDEAAALAVYKPVRGEMPLWDFPEGTLGRREVAAYLVADALGWPPVPPTVLREDEGAEGSLQLFVDADLRQHYFTLRDQPRDEFLQVAAFDVIVNNADRKAGHCLLGLDDRIWFVDHGVCFHVEPKLRTVIWDHRGEPVPEPLLADARRLVAELREGPLGSRLVRLLSEAEVEAAAVRAEALVRHGRYPYPTGERPYPWPPV